MARVPSYYSEAVPRGPTPRVPVAPGVDTRQLSSLVNGMAEVQVQKMEQAADQRARARATEAQGQLGSTQIAQAPDTYSERFAEVFAAQARAVNQQQVALSAEATNARLLREYKNDPEGYAGAWDAYIKGTVSGLQRQDADQAVAVELTLKQYGQRQLLRVEENAYATEQSALRADFLRGYQERVAVFADQLLASGDEAENEDAVAALEATLLDGVETGYLSPDEGNRLVLATRQSLATERITGAFTQALQRNDIGGARGLISALQAGEWFDDNADARALASRLSQQLDGVLSGGGGMDAGMALKLLTREVNAIQQGVVSEGAIDRVQQLADFVESTGTPMQGFDAAGLRIGGQLLAELGEVEDSLPIGELENYVTAVGQIASQIPPATLNAVVERVRGRQADIRAAVNEGDIARLGGALVWAEATPAQIQQRRVAAATVAQTDPRTVSPWTRTEIKQMASAYGDAAASRDAGIAVEVLSKLLEPAGGNGWEAARIALEARSVSGDLAAGAILTSAGRPGDALLLLQAAQTGRGASLKEIGGLNVSEPSVMDTEGMRDTLAGVTMGDPRLVEPVRTLMFDAYKGFLAEATTRGLKGSVARLEAERRLIQTTTALRDVETFSNDYAMPRALLPSDPGQRRRVVAEVNRYLRDPALLNLPPSAAAVLDRVAPRPVAEGQIAFVDTLTGSLLYDQGAAGRPPRPIVVDVEEVAQRPAPPGWGERVTAAVGKALTPSGTERRIMRVAQAADAVGANSVLLESVVTAADLATPQEAGADRANSVGRLSPEALRFIDEAQVREAARKDYMRRSAGAPGVSGSMKRLRDAEAAALADTPLTGETLAPYAVAAYVKALEQRYSDPEQVAAAYWGSPDAVDAAVAAYGADWRRAMPQRVQTFLGRFRAKQQ